MCVLCICTVSLACYNRPTYVAGRSNVLYACTVCVLYVYCMCVLCICSVYVCIVCVLCVYRVCVFCVLCQCSDISDVIMLYYLSVLVAFGIALYCKV